MEEKSPSCRHVTMEWNFCVWIKLCVGVKLGDELICWAGWAPGESVQVCARVCVLPTGMSVSQCICVNVCLYEPASERAWCEQMCARVCQKYQSFAIVGLFLLEARVPRLACVLPIIVMSLITLHRAQFTNRALIKAAPPLQTLVGTVWWHTVLIFNKLLNLIDWRPVRPYRIWLVGWMRAWSASHYTDGWSVTQV